MADGKLQTTILTLVEHSITEHCYGILNNNLCRYFTDQVLTKKRLEESEHNFRTLVMQALASDVCIAEGSIAA